MMSDLHCAPLACASRLPTQQMLSRPEDLPLLMQAWALQSLSASAADSL